LLAREPETRIRALREEQTEAMVGAFCAEPKKPVARLSRKKNERSVEAAGQSTLSSDQELVGQKNLN
jgi:hypothetical protein